MAAIVFSTLTASELCPPPAEIHYRSAQFPLLIRPIEVSDACAVQEAIAISLADLLPFMAWAHNPMTLSEQRDRIATLRSQPLPQGEYQLGVFHESDGTLLMSAALKSSGEHNSKALSIGYWTTSPYANQGLAQLVTKILTIVAIDHMGSDRIQIGCNRENSVSRHVIEKCGFRLEGEHRNYFREASPRWIRNGYNPCRSALLYSLLPEEVEALPWAQEIAQRLYLIYD